MHIIIDTVLVLVFLITIIHYYRIGFVKALFSICKFFLSVVIAFSLASPLGALISEKNIFGHISNIISNIIAFLILFTLSMIAFTILAFVLDKICTLPVLKQTNKLLGLIFGILCGAFHVFASSTIITLVLHLVGVESPELSVEAMREKTFIYSFVENIDLSHLILEFFRSK